MTAGAISTAGGDKITGNSNSISPPVTTHASPVTDPYNPSGILPWITVPPLASLVPRGCPATTGGTLQFAGQPIARGPARQVVRRGSRHEQQRHPLIPGTLWEWSDQWSPSLTDPSRRRATPSPPSPAGYGPAGFPVCRASGPCRQSPWPPPAPAPARVSRRVPGTRP